MWTWVLPLLLGGSTCPLGEPEPTYVVEGVVTDEAGLVIPNVRVNVCLNREPARPCVPLEATFGPTSYGDTDAWGRYEATFPKIFSRDTVYLTAHLSTRRTPRDSAAVVGRRVILPVEPGFDRGRIRFDMPGVRLAPMR
jgi:hypothetical protein